MRSSLPHFCYLMETQGPAMWCRALQTQQSEKAAAATAALAERLVFCITQQQLLPAAAAPHSAHRVSASAPCWPGVLVSRRGRWRQLGHQLTDRRMCRLHLRCMRIAIRQEAYSLKTSCATKGRRLAAIAQPNTRSTAANSGLHISLAGGCCVADGRPRPQLSAIIHSRHATPATQ